MSREDVEVVRRVFDAAARRDTAALLALYDADIVWDASRTQRGALAGRVAHGHDELLTWLREWYGAWETVDDDLVEVADAGDRVVTAMVQRGRGKTSGIVVEDRLGTVWTIRDGRVVEVIWFPSPEEAYEAAGLSEPAEGSA